MVLSPDGLTWWKDFYQSSRAPQTAVTYVLAWTLSLVISEMLICAWQSKLLISLKMEGAEMISLDKMSLGYCPLLGISYTGFIYLVWADYFPFSPWIWPVVTVSKRAFHLLYCRKHLSSCWNMKLPSFIKIKNYFLTWQSDNKDWNWIYNFMKRKRIFLKTNHAW